MLLSLGSARLAFAQDVTVTLGVTRTIKSSILGEDRNVFVRLPTGYDTSGNAYPVLYLLDGTPAFLLEMIASLSHGGVVCPPSRLHGELPPRSIRS
jgi:predicted alpha/beta superfamily hydrolase